MNNGTQQENAAWQTKTVGICVINESGKILLRQIAPTVRRQWDLPHITYNQNQQTALQATDHYLQDLGLTCELHEVFTAQHNQPGGASVATPIEQIVIAFPATAATELASSTTQYLWTSIDTVLKDIQENPVQYAPWLRTIIEGIGLYLKNYLKNRTANTLSVSI